MYVIRKQVYYDKFSQCYKNILVINKRPDGLLLNHVQQIRNVPVSPFQAEANRNKCCFWPVYKCTKFIRKIIFCIIY